MTKQKAQPREVVAHLRVAIAAVDVVLFTILKNSLHVFLIPVHRPPYYKHLHGLPGGVIGGEENADEAASRHLQGKAYIKGVHIEQLYTFSDPKRDKRSRSISIAYMALVSSDQLFVEGNRDGTWLPVSKLPQLAYDHSEIIRFAVERLKGKLAYTNIVANLLPKEFTLTELQKAYEVILDREVDKRNFRKKMMSAGLIKQVNKQRKTAHRPAQLYTFVKKTLTTLPEVRTSL